MIRKGLKIISLSLLCFSPQAFSEASGFFARHDGNQFQPAMRAAFEGRRWAVVAEGHDYIVGEIHHRSIDARLRVHLKGSQLVYSCDCTKTRPQSSNVHAAMSAKTADTYEYVPVKWIKNLQKDFEVFSSEMTPVPMKPAPVAQADAATQQMSDLQSRLRKLNMLYEQKLITKEDYTAKKQQILSEI